MPRKALYVSQANLPTFTKAEVLASFYRRSLSEVVATLLDRWIDDVYAQASPQNKAILHARIKLAGRGSEFRYRQTKKVARR